MEKFMVMMVEELTTRVLAKIGENNTNMMDFLKVKIKAENIEGLTEIVEAMVEEKIGDAVSEAVSDNVETEVKSLLRNASVNIDV